MIIKNIMAEENKKSALKSAFKQPGEPKMKKNVSLSLELQPTDSTEAASVATDSTSSIPIKVPDVSDQTKSKKNKLAINIDTVKTAQGEEQKAAKK